MNFFPVDPSCEKLRHHWHNAKQSQANIVTMRAFRRWESRVGKPGNTGLRRLLRATKYSAQGLRHAWRHEAAFRQESALLLVAIPLALWLGRSPVETTLLIGSCVLVIVVELLNSAVEAAVDRVSDERHELSGRAKDMGSAAVFVSLLLAGLVWATVAWQRLG